MNGKCEVGKICIRWHVYGYRPKKYNEQEVENFGEWPLKGWRYIYEAKTVIASHLKWECCVS